MKDTIAFLYRYLDTLKFHHTDTINQYHYFSSTPNNSSTLWSNILTIFLALLAGLIALYQVKSNTIATSRISWIETLRIAISDYCVETIDTITHLKNIMHQSIESNNINYVGFAEDYNKYFDCNSRADKLAYKCKLLLNPDEAKHNTIIDLIEKNQSILDTQNIQSINMKSVRDDIEKIINLSKDIFKEEWTKSKKLFKI